MFFASLKYVFFSGRDGLVRQEGFAETKKIPFSVTGKRHAG